MRFCCALLTLALACGLAAAPALAQDDDDYEEQDYEEQDSDEYGEPEQIEIQGIASLSYAHSFQDTSLPGGGSFDDGNGGEVMAGFTMGQYLAFLLSMDFQAASHYQTYYTPLSVRMYSPSLLDERLKLYGQASIGLFFSEISGKFDNAQSSNERGSAVRVGGGVEIGITEHLSGIVYGNYLWGLGSTDDYEYGTVGLGLQYRWDL